MATFPTSHLDGKRVRQMLDLIARGDEHVQFETFRRLALSASFMVEKSGSRETPFQEFKSDLTPERAEAAAKRARLIAFGLARAESPVDEVAFLLIAASLYARAGARWMMAEDEAIIDGMIAAGESLFRASRREPDTGTPGSSSATR